MTKAAQNEQKTGEWKHVFLNKISLSSRIEIDGHTIARNLSQQNANAIITAHNAALAAEQARCYNDGWVAGRESMEQQLVAQREIRQIVCQCGRIHYCDHKVKESK